MDIKETIAAMLTENTGTHMLDSGALTAELGNRTRA